MYDFPPGTILGVAAGLLLLVMAACSLWGVRNAGAQQKTGRILEGIGYGVLAISALVPNGYGLWVAWAMSKGYFDANTTWWQLGVTGWTLIGLVIVAGVAVTRGTRVTAALTMLALTGVLTGLANMKMFVEYSGADNDYVRAASNGWAFANSLGWIIAGIAFLVVLGGYLRSQRLQRDQKQFEAGKLAGLDEARQQQLLKENMIDPARITS